MTREEFIKLQIGACEERVEAAHMFLVGTEVVAGKSLHTTALKFAEQVEKIELSYWEGQL